MINEEKQVCYNMQVYNDFVDFPFAMTNIEDFEFDKLLSHPNPEVRAFNFIVITKCTTKGNTYEILRNIDEKVMERDTRRITDKSLASGIEGIFLYVLVRLTTHPLDILFDKNYLNELYDIAKIIQKEDEEEHVFLNNYIKWFEGKIIESDIFSLRSCLNLSDTLLYKGNIWNCGIGLKDGCAGIGMKLMMEI